MNKIALVLTLLIAAPTAGLAKDLPRKHPVHTKQTQTVVQPAAPVLDPGVTNSIRKPDAANTAGAQRPAAPKYGIAVNPWIVPNFM